MMPKMVVQQQKFQTQTALTAKEQKERSEEEGETEGFRRDV